MRISDWSSDVCSSDLRRLRRLAEVADRTAADDRAAVAGGAFVLALRAVHRTLLRDIRARRRSRESGRDNDGRDDGDERARHLHRHRRHFPDRDRAERSEEHTSELKSLMNNTSAVVCTTKKTIIPTTCNKLIK